MPDRYHIKTVPTPRKFRQVGKYGTVDWREDCSRCSNCVKPRCLYDAYRKEALHDRDPESSIVPLYECRACLSCVQGCTKGLLSMSINPEFLAMGDEYWTPDVIATTWNQADTGRIPVSGAGYRGRFCGPGFDSIWTDMSEIVRPTRDGIHGREYISTSVDVGPKPMRLSFSADGRLLTRPAPLVELPIPAVLDVAPWKTAARGLGRSRLEAARGLETLAVLRIVEALDSAVPARRSVVPLLTNRADLLMGRQLLSEVRMVEIEDGPEARETAAELMRLNPNLVLAMRLPLAPSTAARVIEVSRTGIKVFHLCADPHGDEVETAEPRHLKDSLREVHRLLLLEGVRDEITLIVGGGIALAEHMAKAIICGADLVAIDAALLVALGCRVCGEHSTKAHEERCPAEIGDLDVPYAAQRIVNLVGAWHAQLVEVLGAMGIREVRRLRGEVGRAIFMEEIEQEAFGDLVCK